MLRVKDLRVSYGSILALKGVSLEVNDGELISLIGANGAGKTTILHTISGLLRPQSGEIELDSTDLLKVAPHKIIGLGMAQVPEGRHVFARMSVLENLYMGAYTLGNSKKVRDNLDFVYEHFPRLKERESQIAGTLSGGEQQMLATARALMTSPRMLLMDEPSMGLSPLLVSEIFSIIRGLHSDGITILLVEQNARMALSVADRAYVLENGSITLSGTAQDMLKNDLVKKAYLGA